MTVKINSLELENVKRIKAVKLVPSANGLTILGGKNGQGKTSVLDAIAWALGGERYKPSEPQRQGSVTPPILHIESVSHTHLRVAGLISILVSMNFSKRAVTDIFSGFI